MAQGTWSVLEKTEVFANDPAPRALPRQALGELQ
jgi:hypothetical protein